MNGQIIKKSGRPARRWPERLSLLLFMLLCGCITYWVMQLDKPSTRVVFAPQQTEIPQIDVSTASGLFGGRGTVVVASNYQLLGIVAAKNSDDSVAIISADGKPSRAVRQGKELLPGTRLREVHATYVLLSEGGVLKRVTLPENLPLRLSQFTKSPVLVPVPANLGTSGQ